jgi:sugar fermentation stimulation protein A
MKFPAPIEKGVLIKRYKRFLADIQLENEVITAHCANTGSMTGVKTEGSEVWVSKAQNKNRKLGYDWQVIRIGGANVCINTATANTIVSDAIADDLIPELRGYETLRREVKYGENSRIDILLENPNTPRCYVEVKNVTLSRQPPLAEFPDSPTVRGSKHLNELAQMAQDGHRAVMFYCVNRTDCTSFSLADDIDPEYVKTFKAARLAGMEILVYDCEITEDGISISNSLKIVA